MLRLHLWFVSSGQWLFPILNASLKGTVVLLAAGATCLVLRRDSAATRHLVWATAVTLVVVMPLLSVLLPQWHVLPNWSTASRDAALSNVASPESVPAAEHATGMRPSLDLPANRTGDPVPVVEPLFAGRRTNAPNAERRPAVSGEADFHAGESRLATIAAEHAAVLAVAWLGGCVFVVLRLGLAVLVLQQSVSRCRIVTPLPMGGACDPNDGCTKELALLAAVDAAAARLGVKRSVQVLLDSQPSIPTVWGLARLRLRLPAEATDWNAQQKQSVLLHELAHIRRHDLMILTLTQFACAVHWFNPLVWLAAWRMRVERERACDDLVLSAGVRPSTYAEHLVECVGRLRPVAWTGPCGLAMARRSSLEERLAAVLSGRVNRCGLTRLLVAAILVSGTLIAIPLAMLHAMDPPQNTMPTVIEESVEHAPGALQDRADLDPGTWERLQWGEPVNGLRAALVRPQALGGPPAGEVFDFILVVQNMSDAPVRMSPASAAAMSTYLKVRRNDITLAGFRDSQPTHTEFVLQPREVAMLRLFSGRTEGDSITADDPALTFSAELTVDDAPDGAWTGKLVTAELNAAFAGFGLMPEHQDAEALFKVWNAGARGNGMIPGALIGLLADSVATFTINNPTWKTTPQLLEMLPRLDATRDWSGKEAVTLLERIAAVQDTPIKMALDREMERTIRTGTPLPPELADAPWGKALPNGLRMAWLLEPQAAEYRLGTPLKSRILIHNTGATSVVFRTRTWHQGSHMATDANGVEIKTESVRWTTIGRLVPFRLAPGEFVELNATGVGVGARTDTEDWQNTRVGTWIEADVGDEVTVTTAPVPLSDWNEEPPPDGQPGWWLDHVTATLARHRPLPADGDERARLLYRVALELFGTPVGAEETAAFVADRGPATLESLAKRLAHRPGLTPYTGSLQSGPTRFRVLPADPDAAKRPRDRQ